jgi:hypothetical protein
MTIRRFVSVSVFGLVMLVLASASAGASNPKGVRIVSVRALPAAEQMHTGQAALSPVRLNTVMASTALAFQVRLRNEGASAQKDVSATVTISRPAGLGGPSVHQSTLAILGPNQTKTVTIGGLGEVPFAERTSLVVRVSDGVRSVYPVIFSLPSGNGTAVASPANPVAPTGVPGSTRPITIPSLVGMPQQLALARLQQIGMKVLVVSVYSDQAPTSVVAQSPGEGSRLTPGSIVTINVSRGPKPH